MMFDPEIFGISHSGPYLKIERQPRKYGYRFRYKTEGVCHGGILADTDGAVNCGSSKSCPKIKVHNLNGQRAKVVLRLAAEHDNETMHIHSLVYNKTVTNGVHLLTLNEVDEVELEHVAVQQEKTKETKNFLFKERVLQSEYLKKYNSINPPIDVETFVKRLEDREDKKLINRLTGVECNNKDLQSEASSLMKDLNVHSVVLAFHCFLEDSNGRYTINLPTVYSVPIYDGKNKKGCEYKILRLSSVSGTPKGGEEVWMLCDKFDNTPVVPWSALAIVNKSDVYNQNLIIFRTPPYKHKVLDQPVKVKIELRAASDHMRCSKHFDYTYNNSSDDGYEVGKKRKKTTPAIPDFDVAQLKYFSPQEQLNQLFSDEQNLIQSHVAYNNFPQPGLPVVDDTFNIHMINGFSTDFNSTHSYFPDDMLCVINQVANINTSELCNEKEINVDEVKLDEIKVYDKEEDDNNLTFPLT
ncbi:nuclear factor of kappa light polypeptide enhancer in B-cells isoform X1 [Hydra vulgaris]|uniref:nuclear factor of kappa light polypeptide enhancer in B-cells isoform X1 n=1 Tax=Hydra vulgaris TaxID=6087 RepID=UPI001F5F3DC1|nr:nuclear factor of kappa light polypeptide enhancer in B-cells isoform X1 [Hydra vulgaris]